MRDLEWRQGARGQRLRRGATDMTMWDILFGACFLVPISTAIQAASAAGAGIGGYASSLMIGLLIGIGLAFSMRSLHRKLVEQFQAASSAVMGVILVAAFIVELAWVGAAGFVGWSTTSAVLHSVH